MEFFTNNPTAKDANAPKPNWIAPIKAEALPAFLLNGANVNPAVLGFEIPKHAKKINKKPMVSYNPNKSFIAVIKNKITTIHCVTRAPNIIFSLENHLNKTEFNWLAQIKLKDIKAKIHPYVLGSTLKISIKISGEAAT